MDPGFLLIENFGRFVAIAGMLMAAPLFAWAGWMYMSSMGDPNRSASARNSVICVCVGIVIIGCAFLIPGIVSDAVVEPVGGVTFDVEGGVNCDQILRDQLVLNREASNALRINYVIRQIQARFDDCRKENWSPVAKADDDSPSTVSGDCFDDSVRDSIAGVQIPAGLIRDARSSIGGSGRDAYNNIIVHWWTHPEGTSSLVRGLPSDFSVCWMYIGSLDTWIEGY